MKERKPCCDGVETINKKLAETNAVLVTNLFGAPRVALGTCKLRERERAKKTPYVFASFCPFCGVRYEGAL